jgi:hypothetical protein
VDYHNNPSPSAGGPLSPEAIERLRGRTHLLLGAHPPEAPAPDSPPAPTEAPDAAQRRHTARHKTMISGKLVFNDMASAIDCIVRDLSETGARIKLAAPVQLPPVFILRFNDGHYHRCKVRRRTALEFGVEFLD